jgi:uncharacterized membrane protein
VSGYCGRLPRGFILIRRIRGSPILQMKILDTLGPLLFCAAMILFGVQHLVYAASNAPMAMGYPWIPVPRLLAYAVGAVLILLALAVLARKRSGTAALLLALLLAARAVAAFVPILVAHPRNGGMWTTLCELIAMSGAGLMVAGTAGRDAVFVRLPGLGRVLFGLPLLVFGVQHFLYARYVATLVPSWIPGHLFWALFVGVAFLAASTAVLLRKGSRPAALLLGVMFACWVLLLHLPRALASPRNGYEWTSAFVALAMCGGAWITAALDRASPAA